MNPTPPLLPPSKRLASPNPEPSTPQTSKPRILSHKPRTPNLNLEPQPSTANPQHTRPSILRLEELKAGVAACSPPAVFVAGFALLRVFWASGLMGHQGFGFRVKGLGSMVEGFEGNLPNWCAAAVLWRKSRLRPLLEACVAW